MNAFIAAAVDFETTGSLPGFPNEPWQIGIAEIRDGEISTELFDSLINVGDRPFNRYVPGRHAQLRAQIAVAPTFEQLWPVVSEQLAGRVLVAHNTGTERSILSAASPLHVFGPWIDTLVLSRFAWPALPSHALEDVVSALGIAHAVSARCPGRGPHDACYDAVASAAVLLHLLEQPQWQSMTAADLVALCGG